LPIKSSEEAEKDDPPARRIMRQLEPCDGEDGGYCRYFCFSDYGFMCRDLCKSQNPGVHCPC